MEYFIGQVFTKRTNYEIRKYRVVEIERAMGKIDIYLDRFTVDKEWPGFWVNVEEMAELGFVAE